VQERETPTDNTETPRDNCNWNTETPSRIQKTARDMSLLLAMDSRQYSTLHYQLHPHGIHLTHLLKRILRNSDIHHCLMHRIHPLLLKQNIICTSYYKYTLLENIIDTNSSGPLTFFCIGFTTRLCHPHIPTNQSLVRSIIAHLELCHEIVQRIPGHDMRLCALNIRISTQQARDSTSKPCSQY
jgi:hypothetical protein